MGFLPSDEEMALAVTDVTNFVVVLSVVFNFFTTVDVPCCSHKLFYN